MHSSSNRRRTQAPEVHRCSKGRSGNRGQEKVEWLPSDAWQAQSARLAQYKSRGQSTAAEPRNADQRESSMDAVRCVSMTGPSILATAADVATAMQAANASTFKYATRSRKKRRW